MGKNTALQSASVENKGGEQRREGTPKHLFTPLENLISQKEELSMMANRRPTFDPRSNDSTLLVGTKLPRSNGRSIRDKISLWEAKEPTHTSLTLDSVGQSGSAKRAESLMTTNNKCIEDKQSCRKVAHKEKQDLEKENVGKLGDSRPCSPVDSTKQQRGTFKPGDNQMGEDCRRVVVHKEKQDHEKENVEKLGDSRPCSPTATEKQQLGTLKKSNDRRAAEQTSHEKRAVFSLFKKLEAMGGGHRKTPPELGNYFSPPNKDKQLEVKKNEAEDSGPRSAAVRSSGTKEGKEQRENVYTEPGSLPINPVPKPRRTFQHPDTATLGRRQGRGQRNLPPLPSLASKTSLKPPSGVYGRPRGERVRDNLSRYQSIRKINSLMRLCQQCVM